MPVGSGAVMAPPTSLPPPPRPRDAEQAAGMVADVAYGVDGLPGAARGDDNAAPGQVAVAAEEALYVPQNGGCVGEAADADGAGGEMPNLRRNNRGATLLQQAQVGLGRGMLVHVLLHGGDEQEGRGAGEGDGAKHIVGESVGKAGKGAGGGGRDDQQLGGGAQLDVARGSLAGRLPEISVDGAMAEGGEGEGANELGGALGE